MWLGEKITDKGIGNGISLIIMVGIIATLPLSFATRICIASIRKQWWINDDSNRIDPLGCYYLIIYTIVMAVRQIPVQYARRTNLVLTTSHVFGSRQYIPLKLKCIWCNAYYFCSSHYVCSCLCRRSNGEIVQWTVDVQRTFQTFLALVQCCLCVY